MAGERVPKFGSRRKSPGCGSKMLLLPVCSQPSTIGSQPIRRTSRLAPVEMERDPAARARNEADAATRAEWELMGTSYKRLAEQAERNATTDIVYEIPTRDHSCAQQQQQPQSQKDQRLL